MVVPVVLAALGGTHAGVDKTTYPTLPICDLALTLSEQFNFFTGKDRGEQSNIYTQTMPARAGSQDSKTPSTILAGVEDDARRAGEELGTRGSSHWANGKATTGAPYHRRNRQSKTESTPANGGVSGGGGGGIEKLLLPLRKVSARGVVGHSWQTQGRAASGLTRVSASI